MVIRTKEEQHTQNPSERENKAMIKKEQIYKNDSHRKNALIAAHQQESSRVCRRNRCHFMIYSYTRCN